MKIKPTKLLVIAPFVLTALVVCRPEPTNSPWNPAAVSPLPPPLSASWTEIVPLRFLAKQLIAREVTAGVRRLVEAAALFRELNRLPPAAADPPDAGTGEPRARIPRDTDQDRLCWQVVKFVYFSLRDVDPDRANELVARLEAEYSAELRAHGAILLPEASSLEPVTELLERGKASTTDAQWRSLSGASEEGDTRESPR